MRTTFQFVEQIQGRTSIRGNPVCALCEVNGVTTKVTPFAYSLSYENRLSGGGGGKTAAYENLIKSFQSL